MPVTCLLVALLVFLIVIAAHLHLKVRIAPASVAASRTTLRTTRMSLTWVRARVAPTASEVGSV
jgi:hypothetical protein